MSHLDIPSLAVDLPGRGRTPSPRDEVTPESCAAHVAAQIVRNDLSGVTLVGHSLGGLTILRVADLIPERISRLVFIASPVPDAGQSVAEFVSGVFPTDPETLGRGPSQEWATELFASDLDAERTHWLLTRLCPEAPGLLTAAVDLAGLNRPIPRFYVRTSFDHACPPGLQDRSIRNLQPVEVIAMDTGHSVMVSAPAALAEALQALTRPPSAAPA
jgi:pimeloyl-ACP methyl ester carboxylesterase